MKTLRTALRRTLLRGPLLRQWTRRRARQLEDAYLTHLRREAAGPVPADPPLPTPLPHAPPQPLRRLLFIGDCMWEPGELFPELRKMAAVDCLDLRPALRAAPPGGTRDAVARAIEQFALPGGEPDVILFYARPSLLSDAAFDLVRRRWKCPLLGMNLDDRVEFFPYGVYASGDDDYARWAPKFDLNLTNAWTALDWYRRRGAAVRYLAPGFHPDPALAAPPASARFEHPFSFVGSWKLERGEVIDALRRHGVDIRLFGQGWPGGAWVDSPARVFRASQLNLGIGIAVAGGHLTTAKARDFECPGAGACYLTTYHWELARNYEVGREILLYRGVEELVEMHSYYAARPEACLRIAQAAHRRALAEHTWERRFRTLFAELGFQAST